MGLSTVRGAIGDVDFVVELSPLGGKIFPGFRATSVTEISIILSQINTHKSAGVDDIPDRFFKMCSYTLAAPVCNLIETIITNC